MYSMCAVGHQGQQSCAVLPLLDKAKGHESMTTNHPMQCKMLDCPKNSRHRTAIYACGQGLPTTDRCEVLQRPASIGFGPESRGFTLPLSLVSCPSSIQCYTQIMLHSPNMSRRSL
ncbi:hypothetical protein FJTKL_04219 [Diaporthe vaccinii]|uniref:Uncharacterized protein n=1 Tax=Diaporthe vaccinii TaxID=105482 RepID=A0ABR4F097_9PEZI